MADAPTVTRYYRLWWYAKGKGLTNDAATLYATLMWWGLHYGYEPADIHSGRRSAARQRQMQRDWDAGKRAGLVVRPADDSPHVRGEGFDLERVSHLPVYGSWANAAGGRWGGNFTGVHAGDDVHFDTGG